MNIEPIRIELTDEQITALEPIMDEIRRLSNTGNPGMAVAQIYYDHAVCGYLDHFKAYRVQMVLGNPGKTTGKADDRRTGK